jgi:predicted secreted protein
MKNRAIVWIFLVGLIVLAGIAGTGYWLFKKKSLNSQKIGLAAIVDLTRQVEARAAGKIDWQNAQLQQQLFDGDSVKTALESAALIRYLEDDTIRLEENSLVIIHDRRHTANGDEADLEILSGSLVGNSKGVRLRIKTSDSLTVLEPSGDSQSISQVVVTVGDDKKAQVSLLQGSATTKIGENQFALQSGEGFEFDSQLNNGTQDPSQQSKVPPVLVKLPEIPKILDFQTSDIEGSFTLNIDSTSPIHHLQIAKDAKFSEMIVSRYFSGTTQTIPQLPPGEYYWKIASLTANRLHGTFSPVQHFSISAVTAASPAITTTPTPVPMNFSAHFYELQQLHGESQLWKSQTLKPLAAKNGIKLSSGDRLDVGANAILSLDFAPSSVEPLMELRSNTSIKILQAESGVPINSTEQQNVVQRGVVELLRGAMVIHIDPQRHPEAQQQIQIDTTKIDFSKLRLHGQEKTAVLLERILPNDYRLTVLQGETPVGLAESSAKPTAPLAAIPVKVGQNTTVHYDIEMPLLQFEWQPGSTPCQLQVSDELQFKQLIFNQPAPQTSTVYLPTHPGTYYWRCQTDKGESTPISKLVVTDQPLKFSSKKNSSASISDQQPVTIVSYYGFAPRLNWNWRRVDNAVSYQLEIFVDANLGKPLFQSEKLRQNQVTVVIDALVPGEYYWHIRAMDYRGKQIQVSSTYKLLLVPAKESNGLKIISPQNNQLAKSSTLLTKGWVAGAGKLFINDKQITVSGDGEFQSTLSLHEGENLLIYRLDAPGGLVTIDNKKVFLNK